MIISQKCEIINLNKISQNSKSELIFVADECFRVPQHNILQSNADFILLYKQMSCFKCTPA